MYIYIHIQLFNLLIAGAPARLASITGASAPAGRAVDGFGM